MNRARWQEGSLRPVGKHIKQWELRYLEDVVVNGQVSRVQRSVRIGTMEDFPTERAARREARKFLDPINSKGYRPKHKITFKEFSERWERDIMPAFKASGRASVKSNIRILNKWFSEVELNKISNEMLQRWITARSGEWSAKTITNYLSTLQRLWNKAKDWKYVSGESPFENLVLPESQKKEIPGFTVEQMNEIINRANEPFKTFFFLLASTGMRGCEACALMVKDIDFGQELVTVNRSVFRRQEQSTKTDSSVRTFSVTGVLLDKLKELSGKRTPESYVFADTEGRPYDQANLSKRVLKPILEKMGIEGRIGLHAFRHGNRNAMKNGNVIIEKAMDRLGHASLKMSTHYAQRRADQDVALMFDGLFGKAASTSLAGDGSTESSRTKDGREAPVAAPSLPRSLRSPANSSSETVQTLAMGAD